jgi:hypothetical protein
VIEIFRYLKKFCSYHKIIYLLEKISGRNGFLSAAPLCENLSAICRGIVVPAEFCDGIAHMISPPAYTMFSPIIGPAVFSFHHGILIMLSRVYFRAPVTAAASLLI